ncbi:MAG TPA: Fe-S-containing protein [Coriobacteriia bacterium]|nr:Fe-S-containing protein [Coriobacteriia bacterium]
MSKKKHKGPSAQKQANPAQNAKRAPEPKRSKAGLIVLAVLVVAVLGVVASSLAGQRGGGEERTPTTDEARYMGRLLPVGYQAPVVGQATTYSSAVEMTELTAALSDTQLVLPVSDVTSAKLALFKYERPGADSIPMIAYVKPSGKLFVGVSYCPPCQGEWQTIQPDGTLTCNACGTKRDLESMVGISGACKLYPLDEIPVTVVGSDVEVERSALDSWTPQPLDREVG